jgi:hypothetical protein
LHSSTIKNIFGAVMLIIDQTFYLR